MKNINEQSAVKGKIRIVTTDSKTGKILRTTPWVSNMVMLGTDTGKDLILDRLNAVNTYSLNITHADIGTGTNSPAVSDIALQAAVTRAAKTTGSVSAGVLSLQFFFSDASLPNGTYREFGSFVDGSAGTGTGKIFNRALFGSAYVKATGEDTTIQLDVTLT